MKKFRRILAVALCLILTLGTVSTGIPGLSTLFAAKAEGAYTGTLRENADGSFRILQLSDIQDNSYLSAKAFATIRLAVRKYNPDLIVLTGDNVLNCCGDHVFRTTVDCIVDEFRDASGNKIPFAVTFGNHDYEVNYRDEEKTQKISLREQYEYYLSKGAVRLSQDGLDLSAVSSSASDNSATLWGTGYIDVYTNDGSKVARRVILLNTGSYDGDDRNRFARVGYNVETQREESYSNVVSAADTWTNAVNGAGEKIKCIVYQHIALQEVYLGDSPAESILTKPTVPGSITHASYYHINNDAVTVNPENGSRMQYVVSTKNPTLTGVFDEAPKSSYNSTKALFKALAKDNVIGLFYGHDHGNTVSAETKITCDGVKYTLTQGFGGGIDVYDGNYDGIDPQGSCYVIDKDGDLIKEAFSYTYLLTDGIVYPSGNENIRYIKEVALFSGTSFEGACTAAENAGYIPVTKAFSESASDADLNSNGRGNRNFSGDGSQYECIAYKQTVNPDEAITDLRVFITEDTAYSRSNQFKTYKLNGNESVYRTVSGCGGNVNYGLTCGAPCAFLYYTTDKNAGSPLTELFVEVEKSSSVNACRTIDHRGLQTGNFAETFGTNDVPAFSKVRTANLNPGTAPGKVVGDSVFLFLKRYDGCSGYNANYSCSVDVQTPDVPDADTDSLLDTLGGYVYGVCQPNGNYELLSDAGFNWVRFDVPCPFDKNGYNNGNIKYVRNEYKAFKAKCQAYKNAGFNVLAVTPYPKDLISDMSIQFGPDSVDAFMDIAEDVIKYIYNDVRGSGNHLVDAMQITNEMGLVTFMAPLNLEQAAAYIGTQLEAINAEKIRINDNVPIGYNCADLLQTSKDLIGMLQPYHQYCDFVAIDLYTGNQGEASPADYVKKVNRLHSMTGRPVIITEFGYWSEGGLKTAEQKAAILYDNYGYRSEAEAIADGQNFINKLPSQFRKTLNQDYPGRESDWPSLVFSKYSNHFYGETSPYTINDIPHSPEGQGEYFREVMTELKKVNCLAGLIIYCCQDHEVCFNCGHSWCPYETKFGLCNYDGTPKPALYAVKELIAGFKAADAAAEEPAPATGTETLKTTVTVYHKNGTKALSCDTGEIYTGGTLVTGAKPVPGYTCTESPAVYSDVSSGVLRTYDTYVPVTYTATLVSDGETSTSAFNIDGSSLVLNVPQKDGYVFTGWKAVRTAGPGLSSTDFIKNKIYSAGTYTGMYGNVTLEAQWEKIPYTVTFDVSNGGTSLSTADKIVHYGEPYGELATVTPPAGYYFAGWNTQRDGSGTVIKADTVCTLSADQTLYACYSDTVYHVSYDNLFNAEAWIAKGGNRPSKPDEQGAVYNAADNSISLTYVNAGGVTGSEVTTSTNAGCMTMPVTAGKTYYFSVDVSVANATQGWANFQLFVFDNTGYTAMSDSGSYVNNNRSAVFTNTYTAPSGATKATIRFSNKTTGATITYKDVRFVEKDVADRLGNSVSYPRNCDIFADGCSYAGLPVPVRTGYVFDGWYSDTGLTDKIDGNDTAAGDLTLYSKWTPLNEITYDNLFSISEFAASKSVILKNYPGNATVDVGSGTITVPGGSGNTPYTSEEFSAGYYTIDIAANTKYYVSFTKENGDGRIFVFFRDVLAANVETGSVVTAQSIEKSGNGYWIGTGFFYPAGTYSFWFRSPTATKITLRFDANGSNTRAYRNVTLIDEAHYYPDSTYEKRFSFTAPGTPYGELQTPTRKDYRFDGWYDNAACTGSPVTSDSVTGSGNVKLYSKWTPAYDVIYNSLFDFDLWGQKAKSTWTNATAEIDFGTNSYTITANSSNNGEVTSEATGGGTNGSNVYAMPVIPGHRYKVSADISAAASNSGDKKYNIFVFEYDTLQRIQNYERIGDSSVTYTLSPGESGTYSLNFTAEADARYIALRLALKSEGASKGTFSNVRIQDMTSAPYPEASVQINASSSDTLLTQPGREGYDADGWYDVLGSDGVIGGTRYTGLSSLNGNRTLYAKYSPKTFTVTYISSVGTPQTFRQVAYGENPAAAYTPTAANGFRFIDWYSDEDCLTFAPTAVTGPLTLYAKWEAPVYNVGYDNIFLLGAQNISGYENSSGTVTETRTVDKTAGTVTMTYLNPADSSERNLMTDFITLPSAAGSSTYYLISADVSATNCSARIMTFFYDESGNPCSIPHTNNSSHPVKESDGAEHYVETPIYGDGTNARHYYSVKLPEGCKKIRLRFDCLNTDVSKKRTAVFSSIRVVEKTADTYATATAVYSTLENRVAYGSPYTLPTVTNPGYSFGGWYQDAACTVPASASLCSTSGDHTLYSKWEINSYRITFDANGGTCAAAGKNVVYNSAYGELPSPAARTGFIFRGWYDSADGGNLITAGTRLTDAEDKTLYARWEHDTFIENFTADVSVENKLLYGPGTLNMSAEALAGQFENTNVSVEMKSSRMATGTTVNLTDDTGTVYDTVTVVIFGDVNGDGRYDGTDAAIVSCIAAGMLTRSMTGDAVWAAADCNHDGVIDSLDVSLLEQAGVLLAGIDQSLSETELQTDSAYLEYLSLIDQKIPETGTETAPEEPDGEPDAVLSPFETVIRLITGLLSKILSFAAYVFGGIAG